MTSGKGAAPSRFRRLLRRIAGVLLLFFLSGGIMWLLAPLPPVQPEESLLWRLPDALPVRLEARGIKAAYRGLRSDRILGRLFNAPSVKRLDAARLHNRFMQEGPGKQALWLLGNQAAVATGADPRREMAGIIRMDNLAWTVTRFELWRRGGLPAEILRLLPPGPEPAYAWHGRDLLLATSRELLEKTRKRYLEPEPWRCRYPAEGLVLQIRPDAPLKDRWEKAMGIPFPPVERMQATLKRSGSQLRLAARIRPDAEWMQTLMEETRKRYGREDIHAPYATVDGPGDALLSSNAIVRLAGCAPPPLWWHAFWRSACGPEAEPGAATAPPLLVLLHDAIRETLVRSGDGRFGVSVLPAPETERTLPVPEVRLAIGCQNPHATYEETNRAAERVASFFRAPGGSPLWEAVRRETRITVHSGGDTDYTSVHLHPLFFHEIRPYWLPYAGASGLAFGTHLPPDGTPPPYPGAAFKALEKEDHVLADLRARWKVPAVEWTRFKTLVMDKAANHEWVPPEAVPPLARGMRAAEAFLDLFPSGRFALRFNGPAGDEANGPEESRMLFWLDMEAILELQE